ncbi:CopY/TcrY family copper transport repressor [Latilactobacillus graminis]|nr:CopY/TcrY family copper transport repressor [Latilactobacillus graminis]QFP80361.1 CopY/TcrY family copper transport repressor [Latilactobacillus graminis]
MTTAKINLTPAEWEIMRIIWTKGAITSNEVITLIQGKKNWSESTIKTLLRRLVKKTALATAKVGRKFIYSAEIDENSAIDQITDDTFSRLCEMKKGAELAKLITSTTLSKHDIQTMQAILAKKLATAPEKVACNCLSGENQCDPKYCEVE